MPLGVNGVPAIFFHTHAGTLVFILVITDFSSVESMNFFLWDFTFSKIFFLFITITYPGILGIEKPKTRVSLYLRKQLSALLLENQIFTGIRSAGDCNFEGKNAWTASWDSIDES